MVYRRKRRFRRRANGYYKRLRSKTTASYSRHSRKKRTFIPRISKSLQKAVRSTLYKSAEWKYVEFEENFIIRNDVQTYVIIQLAGPNRGIPLGPSKNNRIGQEIYISKIVIKAHISTNFVDQEQPFANIGPFQLGTLIYAPQNKGNNAAGALDTVQNQQFEEPWKFVDRRITKVFHQMWYQTDMAYGLFTTQPSNMLGPKSYVVNVGKKMEFSDIGQMLDAIFMKFKGYEFDNNFGVRVRMRWRVYYKDI